MATKQLFGRVVKVHVESDKYKADFSGDNLHIEFEVPFDDDEKPNQTEIRIFNLSKTSISRIIKGASCTLQAGYRSDYGVIAQGKITSVYTNREGVNKITIIKMLEGQDYSGKKTKKPITFKAGTKADVIIKRLVQVLGIRLAEMKLPKNVVYKKGYTVTGNIMNNLVEVVRDSGASMYWRKGKMIIRSIKEGTDERFRLEESTGLIESPEAFEEDGYKGYNVKSLLQHRITTASIIEIRSKTANGKYRVKKGKHICNGSDFITEMQVI
ncbi:hypothetical protein C0966_00770 [Bacillus methanolicus]|uniref:phage protein n=1 Tax=Bacillus methanolicus TaxID=1471 RepID=UPI0023806630|nr:hypothetical protein [Bacillus methanolicus]MDE3837941.1 hypothetical protein [Bacillus methanolicus]